MLRALSRVYLGTIRRFRPCYKLIIPNEKNMALVKHGIIQY